MQITKTVERFLKVHIRSSNFNHFFNQCPFFPCINKSYLQKNNRSNYPEVFLRKCGLKACSKYTGEHPCQSAISIKLLPHGCSPVNFQHIFRTFFLRNTSRCVLLDFYRFATCKILYLNLYFFLIEANDILRSYFYF